MSSRKRKIESNYFARQNIILRSGLVVLVGIVFGFSVDHFFVERRHSDILPIEGRKGLHDFVNPLLECKDFRPLGVIGLRPMKDHVRSLIDVNEKTGVLAGASVYFRDLNNGPWFGINEKDQFLPASLMKVPILIAYFKKAESDSSIFSKRIFFSGKWSVPDEGIPQSEKLVPGRSYTIKELLYRMIAYSDNDAMSLLAMNDFNGSISQVLRELGLDAIPNAGSEDYSVKVKDYAAFFRVLYNASYLNEDLSRRALKLLASATYKRGIPKGLPARTIVAHKFGARRRSDGVQFHDCGIVYHASRPYLLCIMARGKEMDRLVGTVEEISRIVYDGVEHYHGKNND